MWKVLVPNYGKIIATSFLNIRDEINSNLIIINGMSQSCTIIFQIPSYSGFTHLSKYVCTKVEINLYMVLKQ